MFDIITELIDFSHIKGLCSDPANQFGSDCTCFEDNTAYIGNNIKTQTDCPSRSTCQKSCANNYQCKFWSFEEKQNSGICYMKTRRGGVTHGMNNYVSGSKNCRMPEDGGGCEERTDGGL